MPRGFMRRGRKKIQKSLKEVMSGGTWLIISIKINKKVISLPNAQGKNTENKISTSQLHSRRRRLTQAIQEAPEQPNKVRGLASKK